MEPAGRITALRNALKGGLSAPDEGTAHVLLGRLYEIEGRGDQAAAEYAAPAVRQSPLWEYGYFWRLGMKTPALDAAAQERLWKALFSAGPQASFRIEAAEALLKAALADNRTAEAVPYAEALHRAEPRNTEETAQLAGLYEDAGRSSDALPLVESLWSSYPDSPATRSFLRARPEWAGRLQSVPNTVRLTRLRALGESRDYRALDQELKAFHPKDPEQQGWRDYLKGRLAEADRHYAKAAKIYRALSAPPQAAMAGVTRMGLIASKGHLSRQSTWEIENVVVDLPLGYAGRETALVSLMKARARKKQVERACQLAAALLTPGTPQYQADEYLYGTAWKRWLDGNRNGAERLWRLMVKKLPTYADDRHAAVYCLLRLGLLDNANERTLLSSEVLREDAFGYFGYRLRGSSPDLRHGLQPPAWPASANGGHRLKGDLLMEAGFPSDAAGEYDLIDDSKKDQSLWWTLSQAQESAGDYRGAILSVRKAYPMAYASPGREVPVQAWRAIYPLPFLDEVAEASRDANLPAVLVCSVIRQESLWDKEAVSRSGARGLMQLMLPTARHVARANGLPQPTLARLHDPSWNTKAGAAYLERMLKRYNGRLFLALAAYNAGPSRVDAWLKRTNCPDRPDMFIESIPLRETRSYVRRILLNIWEYGRLYPQLRDFKSVAVFNRVYYKP